jgi:pimeloyl-ACP methyl ester carboxylesterase
MYGSMLCENFVVDCPAKSGHEPLKMSIARYFDSAQESTAGVTLLFAHCIGSHKEQWAPTIEEIFVQQRSKPQYQRIREAYAFDRQNHGESAVLNADYLAGLQECISIIDWAEAVRSFVQTHLADHTIISVGHSAGTGCMCVVLPVGD